MGMLEPLLQLVWALGTSWRLGRGVGLRRVGIQALPPPPVEMEAPLASWTSRTTPTSE